MKIGLVQMKVKKDKQENLLSAAEHVKRMAEKGADLVILPEMFCCPYSTTNFPVYKEKEGGKIYQALARMALQNHVYLVGGSFPEEDGDSIYNTSFVFDRNGKCIIKHRKMHLFDIDIKGGQSFKESDTLACGNNVSVFETEFCKIGLCICYDMRFVELSRLMVDKGAKMILCPAAFNMTTGPRHWELMFRSRAVDNQVYTVGIAPARDMEAEYHSYANSIVVSPWGEVIERMDEKEGCAIVDIDLSAVEKVREELPLLKQRRFDIYELNEK